MNRLLSLPAVNRRGFPEVRVKDVENPFFHAKRDLFW